MVSNTDLTVAAVFGLSSIGHSPGHDIHKLPPVVSSQSNLMTILWFIIWLICNNVGANEPLTFDPVNVWAGTLLAAVALDLGSSHAYSQKN